MSEQQRKWGPLTVEHALAAPHPCPGCQAAFKEGDYVTVVTVGPGDDPEEREKCRTGRAYNAVALMAHWACVTGEEEAASDPSGSEEIIEP